MLWFTSKVFATKKVILPHQALQIVNKDEKFTVKGRLGLEEWADSKGNTRQTLVIFTSHAEPFANGNGADVLDDEP